MSANIRNDRYRYFGISAKKGSASNAENVPPQNLPAKNESDQNRPAKTIPLQSFVLHKLPHPDSNQFVSKKCLQCPKGSQGSNKSQTPSTNGFVGGSPAFSPK